MGGLQDTGASLQRDSMTLGTMGIRFLAFG